MRGGTLFTLGTLLVELVTQTTKNPDISRCMRLPDRRCGEAHRSGRGILGPCPGLQKVWGRPYKKVYWQGITVRLRRASCGFIGISKGGTDEVGFQTRKPVQSAQKFGAGSLSLSVARDGMSMRIHDYSVF